MQTKMKKDTETIKKELLAEHNFTTDRELLKLLGIDKTTSEGQKKISMIFAWIRYQNAFWYNNGYDCGMSDAKETRDNEKSFDQGFKEGKESIKEEFREILKKDLED